MLEEGNYGGRLGLDVWETFDDHNTRDPGAACAASKPWLPCPSSYLLLYELEDSTKWFPSPVCEASKEAFVEVLNKAEVLYPRTGSSSSSVGKVVVPRGDQHVTKDEFQRAISQLLTEIKKPRASSKNSAAKLGLLLSSEEELLPVSLAEELEVSLACTRTSCVEFLAEHQAQLKAVKNERDIALSESFIKASEEQQTLENEVRTLSKEIKDDKEMRQVPCDFARHY